MKEVKRYERKLETRFKIGEYAGKTLKEVIDTDIDYIKRCIHKVEGFYLDAIAFDYLVEKNNERKPFIQPKYHGRNKYKGFRY